MPEKAPTIINSPKNPNKDKLRATQTLMDHVATDQRFLTDNDIPQYDAAPGPDPYTNRNLITFKKHQASGGIPQNNSADFAAGAVTNINSVADNSNPIPERRDEENQMNPQEIEGPYIANQNENDSVEVEIVPNEQLYEGGQYDRNIVLPTESDYPEFTARKLAPNTPESPDELAGNVAPILDPKTASIRKRKSSEITN